ncbi:McrB family protein [sulfur-oxidizing endosymbiont of Gigantopelta aegis]|uniref:McrB family protein n=1 Tax=sulfur-oxidizing endosymbiont of Gigantopelta aegis TaxID=2794934 RepID=UPI0018DEB4EB|nr:AAA family ATPase [sulfur-oxidizing endosymbiont of Gigantopelta aegis]
MGYRDKQWQTTRKTMKKNLPLNSIFYGPPGTGKTYNTINAAMNIIEPEPEEEQSRQDLKKKFDEYMDTGRIDFVTFHQSFSYEDFVEGLRAKTDNGKLSYYIEPGIFKKICDKAQEDKDKPCVLIIDEINRGNTANIFGELITLIESSKRAGAGEALSVNLPYSKEPFSVPDNLYIIGTMNTADRSLALIDTALRRRFQFIEMLPDPSLIDEITVQGVNIKELLTVINKRIALLYDREHTIGHSFFMSLTNQSNIDDLKTIFNQNILPLLEEYFFEDWEKIRQVLGDTSKSDELQIIRPEIDEAEITQLLGNDYNNNMINSLYSRNDEALSKPDAYIAIYEG